MTKEELEQINSLRDEVKEIKRKMHELAEKDTPEVQDKVKASGKEEPFIMGHATIKGTDQAAARKKSNKMSKYWFEINRRYEKIEIQKGRIEEYINTIEDSRIRRMIEYKYIEDYTYEEIGGLMNYDGSTVRKKIDRYLSEHP